MANASIRLIWVVGYRLTRAEEGLCWGKSAKTVLAQLEWPSISTGDWHSEMGSVYFTYGDNEKALEHYKKALQLDEKYFGKEHTKIAVRSSNLGVILNYQYKTRQALKHLKRSLQINEKFLGLAHPKVANDLVNIGLIHENLNDMEKATKALTRALVIWETTLGDKHPKLAWPLSSLGSVYEKTGKNDEAVNSYTRVVEICKNKICIPQPLGNAYFGLAKAILFPRSKPGFGFFPARKGDIIKGTQTASETYRKNPSLVEKTRWC